MTSEPGTRRRPAELWSDSRAFDYGVGDELRSAQQEVRAEIAACIRRAARLDRRATPGERRVYEAAARLAEGGALPSGPEGATGSAR